VAERPIGRVAERPIGRVARGSLFCGSAREKELPGDRTRPQQRQDPPAEAPDPQSVSQRV